MRPSGKVSFGNLVLLALLAGAVYYGVIVVPLHVDHLDVKEAVAAAHNQSGRNKDDSQLKAEIRARTNQMGQHVEYDRFNQPTVVPGLGLRDDEIIIERSSVTPSVRIEVSYTRTVRLKPTQRLYTMKFRAVKDGVPPQ
jgi:hypothetical protein